MKPEVEVTFGGVSTLPVSSIAARLNGVLSRPMDLGCATATFAPEVKTWTSLVYGTMAMSPKTENMCAHQKSW